MLVLEMQSLVKMCNVYTENAEMVIHSACCHAATKIIDAASRGH